MDKRLFFLMNMAQKKLFRFMDQACEKELEASMTQMAALMVIASKQDCQQKDVAQTLELNKSAITGLVSRMEKNGLLARASSTEDARAVVLRVTPDGQDKLKRLQPMIATMNDIFSDEFSEEEMLTILALTNSSKATLSLFAQLNLSLRLCFT